MTGVETDCVLCEVQAEAEERIKHPAYNRIQNNKMAALL
jgi:hypothetical protein